jgi:hypothetical protein
VQREDIHIFKLLINFHDSEIVNIFMKQIQRRLMQLGFLLFATPAILIKWKPIWEHIQGTYYPPLPQKSSNLIKRSFTKKQNINAVVKSMQQEFKSININEQSQSMQVLLGEKKPIAQYLITEKTFVDQHFFEKYKYIIETGGDPTQMRIPEKICTHVDTIISQHEGQINDARIREISRELKGDISATIGPFSSKASGNSELIAELIIFILRINALKSSRLQILIKGYSDGVVNEKNWPQEIKLEKDGYNFNKIKVLMPVDPNSKNPFRYLATETDFLVPQQYKNKHLPNLRSQFIKQDFIEPFANSCGTKESEVKILNGYNFKDINHKEKRKVQIYVNLFPL